MGKTLEEALEIGKAACQSANNVILIGSTQLKNNHLIDDFKSDDNDLEWAETLAGLFFKAHKLAIGDGEHDDLDVPEAYASLRDMIGQRMNEYLAVVPTMDTRLAFYESNISITEKHNSGNCEEMAIYAMKHIVDNEPGINAELYKVFNGDHVVLVLNKSKSDPLECCEPQKWGPHAVICDPWSNLVYPVSEYKKYLRPFYRIDDKNVVGEWITGWHFLAPHWSLLTSDEVRSEQKKLFCEKLLDLRKALEFFIEKLSDENKRLINEKELKQSAVLDQKISDTIVSINEVDYAIKQANDNDFSADIRQMLKDIFHRIVEKIQFSANEQKTLFGPSNAVEKAFSFFGVSGTKRMKNRTMTKNCLKEIKDDFDQRQIRYVR